MSALPVGKLRAETLERLLARHLAPAAAADGRVVVGPRVGEDAAVIDLGDRYLVATADPVTFATDEPGWYALQVNANDLAVRGARPRWFLATVLLPEAGVDEAAVEALFAGLAAAAAELGVVVVGGHTEVTAGLDRPIIAGAMLGEVARERLVTTAGARVGDAVLLTKGVPLEGAALLARERGDEARRRGVPPAVVRRAAGFLRDPGLSIVPEARLAAERAGVHAMHDPTEGGLATACWELARAGEVGLAVERERIPVLPEGAALCEAFGLDPLGTIASGALLLAVAPAEAGPLAAALGGAGIACAAIGRVTPAGEGVTLAAGGRVRPMPHYHQDEIARVFAGAAAAPAGGGPRAAGA
jgi:hydrogenase maturation factor